MQISSLEKENSELEAEGRRLKKKLDGLKNIAFQLEALEKENTQLEQENLQLRRSAESLRAAGAKAAQLEAENRELESEKSQLKRTLELLKASSKKTERLEVRLHMNRCTFFLTRFRTYQAFVFQVSYQGLDTENQRLQKALENSSKKIQQLEAELQEVETENQTLQRNLEELKISSKRLEQLEQEVGTERQLLVSLLWKRRASSANGREPLVDLCHNFSCLFLLIVPGRMRPGGLASNQQRRDTKVCVVWQFPINIYSLI